MFPPEVYLPDHLLKEILDHFSQLNSLEAVKNISQTAQSHSNPEGTSLFGILQALKVDFDGFAAAKSWKVLRKR